MTRCKQAYKQTAHKKTNVAKPSPAVVGNPTNHSMMNEHKPNADESKPASLALLTAAASKVDKQTAAHTKKHASKPSAAVVGNPTNHSMMNEHKPNENEDESKPSLALLTAAASKAGIKLSSPSQRNQIIGILQSAPEETIAPLTGSRNCMPNVSSQAQLVILAVDAGQHGLYRRQKRVINQTKRTGTPLLTIVNKEDLEALFDIPKEERIGFVGVEVSQADEIALQPLLDLVQHERSSAKIKAER